MNNRLSAIRTTVALLVLTAMPACTRTGINAGEQGGRAFIALTAMLLITAVILVIALGREK